MATLSNPNAVAEAGERIYRERYKADLEAHHMGKFVLIDVLTAQAYLGKSPEEAYSEAKKQAPEGIFHLIRVGSPGAFRVSYTNPSHGKDQWFL